MPQVPFNWSAEFVIADTRATVEVQSDTLNRDPHASFTGTMEGGGQIGGRLRELAADIPAAGSVRDLCDAWDALHLKTISQMTPEEVASLDHVQALLILIDGERFGGTVEFEDIDEADFSESSDVIDSRDVIKRIEELRGAFDAAGIDPEKLDPKAPDYDAQGLAEDHDAHGHAEELRDLLALEEQAEPYAADWRYGETLIRDSYFEDYAEELADDIGAISKDSKWPNNHIDWEAAARELQQDYTSVEFKGVTYWVR